MIRRRLNLKYVRQKNSARQVPVQNITRVRTMVHAREFFTFLYLIQKSSTLSEWKICFYTKPFQDIIIRFRFSRKTILFRSSGASAGMVHMAKAGLYILNRWVRNLDYTMIRYSILVR